MEARANPSTVANGADPPGDVMAQVPEPEPRPVAVGEDRTPGATR
jgi:hypothetical protein